jgi:two-component system, cell cycle response regulator DivK
MSQPHALIIDDNAKNVTVLANMLSEENVTNTQVTNPKQIDSVLNNLNQVDVIFLDLEMPGLDGYQVLQKIKSDARFQGVPVVAYTVHVSEIHAANKGGFDGFIGKPLNADKFPQQLKRILNGQAVWETV